MRCVCAWNDATARENLDQKVDPTNAREKKSTTTARPTKDRTRGVDRRGTDAPTDRDRAARARAKWLEQIKEAKRFARATRSSRRRRRGYV